MFQASVTENLDSLAQQYQAAKPFPHLVIDNFFQEDYAEHLLRDFPPFDPKLAMGDMGKVGPKAVNKKMRAISPFYDEFCNFLVSEDFVKTIEHLTGIEDLISLPDETGGTHDSRTGAVLAPHLDYNYYGENPALHRRLNVLFYLNKDWQSEWGGNLELHSNPRNWAENYSVSNPPLFNRCIIMETSEHSWHGYDPIKVPEDIDASRKSISIYLFTRTRPAEQTAPRHATFYVQPPLNDKFKQGLTLTQADAQELRSAVAKRDNWINFYQNEVLRHSGRAEKQQERVEKLISELDRAASLLQSGELEKAKSVLKPYLGRAGTDGPPLTAGEKVRGVLKRALRRES